MRRDRTVLVVEILELCVMPQIKTRIVYGVGLNFKSVRAPLKELVKHGLLETDGETWVTTRKGRDALTVYKMSGLGELFCEEKEE